jgi:hypothetical protein
MTRLHRPKIPLTALDKNKAASTDLMFSGEVRLSTTFRARAFPGRRMGWFETSNRPVLRWNSRGCP